MRSCKVCGATCDDSCFVCQNCGAELAGGPPPVRRRSKKRSVPVVLTLSLLVAIAAIASLVLVLISTFKPEYGLARAGAKTTHKLLNWAGGNTDVVATADELLNLVLRGEYGAELSFRSEDLTISTGFDLSQRHKTVKGTATVQNADKSLDFSFTYAANKRVFTFALPENSYNVYGFRYKDFQKKISSSPFAGLVPQSVSQELSAGPSIFHAKKTSFEKLVRSELCAFLSRCDVEKLEKREIVINGNVTRCMVYQLHMNTTDTTKPIWSSKTEKKASGNKLLNSLLQNVGPTALCFVNEKNELTGVDFTVAGTQYLLFFEGTENPWSRVTLTQKGLTGQEHVYLGGTELRDGAASLYLKDEEGDLFRLSYAESTQNYSLWFKGLGTILEGSYRAESDYVRIGVDIFPRTGEEAELAVTLTQLGERPCLLARKYIDILNLSPGDVQRILFGLGLKLL